ncbi:hypothetical protein SABIM44S_00400 [Streptomyces abikoensis]
MVFGGEGCSEAARARRMFVEGSTSARGGVTAFSTTRAEGAGARSGRGVWPHSALQAPHRLSWSCAEHSGRREALGRSIFWCFAQATTCRYPRPSHPVYRQISPALASCWRSSSTSSGVCSGRSGHSFPAMIAGWSRWRPWSSAWVSSPKNVRSAVTVQAASDSETNASGLIVLILATVSDPRPPRGARRAGQGRRLGLPRFPAGEQACKNRSFEWGRPGCLVQRVRIGSGCDLLAFAEARSVVGWRLRVTALGRQLVSASVVAPRAPPFLPGPDWPRGPAPYGQPLATVQRSLRL